MASPAGAVDVDVAQLPQHLQALERANTIRLYRVKRKRELAAGAVRLADVLADPEFATARISAVLLSIPRMGPIRVGKLLAGAGLSTSHTCAALSARRRAELVARVAGDELPFGGELDQLREPAVDPDSIEAMLA